MVEHITDRYSRELNAGIKKLTSDGMHPQGVLWGYAKMNLMRKIAKDFNVNLVFDYKGWQQDVMLSKWPLIGNNEFLISLSKIIHLWDYINQYTVVHGHKFWIKPANKMADIHLDYKILDIWEKETTKAVEENVKAGDVCVDVGASVGYFTLLFSRLVGPIGKVIAIEPTDFQQPYLRRNIRKNGYKKIVTQIHCGAWDKDEIVKMPLSAPEYCQFELRCRPLDDILEDLGIFTVDFIKVDVDGPEPKVLKGMERTIKRSPKMKMVIEFYPKYIESGGCSIEDFEQMIDKYFDKKIIPGDYSDGCWNLFCTRK